MFDFNVTLTKVIWRLDSRKSFAINKLIVRNNTIKKWLGEARDVSSKIPPRCNVPLLLALTNTGTRSRAGSVASGSSPALVQAKQRGPTDSPVSSPMLTRAKPSAIVEGGAIGSPSAARHRPTAAAVAESSASPSSPSVARKATAAAALAAAALGADASGGAAPASPSLARRQLVSKAAAEPVAAAAAAAAASSSVAAVAADDGNGPSAVAPDALAAPSPATPTAASATVAAVASPSTDSPMTRRRALLSGGDDSAGSLSPSGSRRFSAGGSLRSKESPNFWITKLEQNDPSLTAMVFEKDVSMVMKHREYIARLATALATATHLRDLIISQCDLDSVDAKAIADALVTNRSLRVLDLSKNKVRHTPHVVEELPFAYAPTRGTDCQRGQCGHCRGAQGKPDAERDQFAGPTARFR